jgi:glycosyltransferase involved in cell wall biosynthesis
MPSVLFLSYFFPPIGGAGGQRNPRLVRYLPDYGYEPVVLTGPGAPDYRWTPFDASLEIPGVEVHRLAGPEPGRGGQWGRRAERWLRRPSAWKRWWHAEALRDAPRMRRVDLVHASIAPYETAETAVAVARRLGRPLVIDFEDPWALDEMMVYPTRLHRSLELGRMLRVLRNASAVVMNTPESARRVRELLPGKNVAVVGNGYDAKDFAGGPVERGDGIFRIVHTGSLHTDFAREHERFGRVRRALGGGVPNVDYLTRSHVFLLEALGRLESELRRPIELHLVGALTPEDEAVLENAPVPVRRHGFLPHAETVALIRSADLLFLPLHDVGEGRRVSIVPCKTYEYLASGNPILAAVPDGDARDLLARCGTALICRPADVEGLAVALGRELRRWRARIAAPQANRAVASAFEYDRLTENLAAVYDDLLRRAPQRAPAAIPAAAAR